MGFLELAGKRYSVRNYKPDEIEDEKLEKVLEAARLAPTAANRQPFQLIVIGTRGKEADLGRIYSKPWFVEAPIVICACAIPEQGWVRRDNKNYCEVDAAIVMDHFTLAAADLGLGTCWIGRFSQEEAKNILGVPDDCHIVTILPLGFPKEAGRPKVRKSIEEIVCYENFK